MAEHHPDGIAALLAAAAAGGLAPPLDRFFFVRHGRTGGNLARRFQHPEEPLCDEGLGDAERAAEILARADFTHMLASDMARAWRTAGMISARTGRPVTVERGLRERFFGRMVGESSENLDWRIRPEGGETLEGFVDRTLAGLGRALAHGGTPLLVSHGGVLYVLAAALGIPLADADRANCVPLELRRTGGTWTLARVA